MATLIERLRWIRREALGLNRRNQDYLLRWNRPALVGLVDHKVRTKEVLAALGLPVPETFASYKRQRQLLALRAEIERRSQFVLKPACGAGGEGVVVVAGRRGDRFVKASGATLSSADIVAQAADIIAGAFSLSQARDEALLEDRLAPDAVLGAYSPGGIPDIRVLIVRGIPLMAMLRLPTTLSDGRANLHVGGVGVGIDMATGRAVHAIWRNVPIVSHPDTKQPLSALQVPHWESVLLLAARSYAAVPLGYMGVDIVIDHERGPMILELNARPGLAIQLANHRGLRRILEAVEKRPVDGLGPEARIELGLDLAGAHSDFRK